MVKVVNVVASGDLGRDVDLNLLSAHLDVKSVQYDPEIFAGAQIRFEDDGPVITVYGSGAYVIMGGKSRSHVEALHQRLCDRLSRIEIDADPKKSRPKIRNLVCKESLGRTIDLDLLVVALGPEQVEYHPESSPFVYYRCKDPDCVMTIPANGEVIVTGVRQPEDADDAIAELREQLERNSL